MGFRFRRSVKITPGVRLNASRFGLSTSIGRRDAWLRFGPRGMRSTVGIPGTGISYTESTSKRPRSVAGLAIVVLVVILAVAFAARRTPAAQFAARATAGSAARPRQTGVLGWWNALSGARSRHRTSKRSGCRRAHGRFGISVLASEILRGALPPGPQVDDRRAVTRSQ